MAFEALLSSSQRKPSRVRQVMFTGSIVVHALALAAGVAYSLWEVDEMPLPAIQVLLADAPPPPPPPPPPAGKKSATKTKTNKVPTKTELVQPKDNKQEKPKPEQQEEDDSDNGEEGGEKGGEKGGVAGGVVGGVVGAAPPPPKPTAPLTLSAGQGRALLAINPNAPPNCCVKVPKALKRMGSFSAQVRVCVSAGGQVTDARVTRGANPAIDSQIPGYVRRWRYRPMLVQGQATPFCYSMTYVIDVGSP